MKRDEWLLRWLLRLVAVAEFGALPALFLPVSWMVWVHEVLGMGAFPEGTLVPYLARHLSAMYVVHGGFLWVASRDVRGQSGLVRYVWVQGFAFAAVITVLDVMAGFPWYWMVAEGPGLAAVSGVILVLQRRVEKGGSRA